MDAKRIENLTERATREAAEKLRREVDHQEVGFDILNDDAFSDLYEGLSDDEAFDLTTSIVNAAQSRVDEAAFDEEMAGLRF